VPAGDGINRKTGPVLFNGDDLYPELPIEVPVSLQGEGEALTFSSVIAIFSKFWALGLSWQCLIDSQSPWRGLAG